MVAGGKGVMRSMICESEFTAEVIPVDQGLLIKSRCHMQSVVQINHLANYLFQL